jgi:hypothetical protein
MRRVISDAHTRSNLFRRLTKYTATGAVTTEPYKPLRA